MRAFAGTGDLGERVDPNLLALCDEGCGIVPPLCVVEIADEKPALVAFEHRVETDMELALPRSSRAPQMPFDRALIEWQVVSSGLGAGVEAAAHGRAPAGLPRARAGPARCVDVVPAGEALGTRRASRRSTRPP